MSLNSATTAIVTTGAALQIVQEMLNSIEGAEVDLFTCPIWGIGSEKNMSSDLSHYTKIISIEDHLAHGGFGSWLLEGLEVHDRAKLRILGLETSICGEVGSQAYLNHQGGLTTRNLADALER